MIPFIAWIFAGYIVSYRGVFFKCGAGIFFPEVEKRNESWYNEASITERTPRSGVNHRFMIHTLLFDLDGTLTDPAEGIANSVLYALSRFGITVADKRELYAFIGPPLADSFGRYYGFDRKTSEDAIGFYREYFKDRGIFENLVYDGILKMLQALKASGKTLLLATSKPEVFAGRILRHFGLAEYFDRICGSLLDNTRTDKHEVIEYALAISGIADRDGCLMIGDRKHDVLGAAASGIATVGVSYGYGSREELEKAGASPIVSDVRELTAYLLSV